MQPQPAGFAPGRRDELNWWLLILRPLLHLPRGAKCKATVAALVERNDLTDWRGRPIKLYGRTIYRRLKSYREEGASAFVAKARSDKGKSRVVISELFDRALNYDHDSLLKMRTSLLTFIKQHRKASLVRTTLISKLKLKEEAAAFIKVDEFPDKTFRVPRRLIDGARREYKVVNLFESRRKTFEDMRPRVRRDPTTLRPMQIVCIDVTPFDIVMLRPDGSRAHARGISMLDVGTARLQFYYVLCEKGTGVRNADLIQAFIEMAVDPAWGVPEEIYVDNGKEMLFADHLEDALQLIKEARGRDGREVAVHRSIVRNAQGKPVESYHAAFNKWIQDCPGYTGGDRMNAHSDSLHRPVKPLIGDLDYLRKIVDGRLLEFDHHEMRGAFAGRTPYDIYTEKRKNWQSFLIDPREIDRCFMKDETRVVDRGAVSWNGQQWHCDGLHIQWWGRKIILRTPLFNSPPDQLAVLDPKTRQLIAVATRQRAYAYGDPEGPKAAAKLASEARSPVRTLSRDIPPIDTIAEGLRLQSGLRKPEAPSVAGIVSISKQHADEAAALAEPVAVREDRRQQKMRRGRLSRLADYERLNNKRSNE